MFNREMAMPGVTQRKLVTAKLKGTSFSFDWQYREAFEFSFFVSKLYLINVPRVILDAESWVNYQFVFFHVQDEALTMIECDLHFGALRERTPLEGNLAQITFQYKAFNMWNVIAKQFRMFHNLT